MLFSEYAADVQRHIAEFSQCSLLVTSELTADMRTEQIGLLKGILTFVDGSVLFFKEYLDFRTTIEKKMYSFHYQDAQAVLRFRYDNAAHKPDLGFQDHKHTPKTTVQSVGPDLADVMNEIANYLTGS
jgi:hypothetical protein